MLVAKHGFRVVSLGSTDLGGRKYRLTTVCSMFLISVAVASCHPFQNWAVSNLRLAKVSLNSALNLVLLPANWLRTAFLSVRSPWMYALIIGHQALRRTRHLPIWDAQGTTDG